MKAEFHFVGLNPILFLSFPKITKRIVPSNITYRSSWFIWFIYIYMFLFYFINYFFFFFFFVYLVEQKLEWHKTSLSLSSFFFFFLCNPLNLASCSHPSSWYRPSPTLSLSLHYTFRTKKGKGRKSFRLSRDICSLPNEKVYI